MVKRDPSNPAFHHMAMEAAKAGIDGNVYGSATDPDVWEQHFVDWLNETGEKPPDLDLAFDTHESALAHADQDIVGWWNPFPADIYEGKASKQSVHTDVWLFNEDESIGDVGLFEQTDNFSKNLIDEDWAPRLISAIEEGVPYDTWLRIHAPQPSRAVPSRGGDVRMRRHAQSVRVKRYTRRRRRRPVARAMR